MPAATGELFRKTLLPPVFDTFLSDAMQEKQVKPLSYGPRTFYQRVRNQARARIAD